MSRTPVAVVVSDLHIRPNLRIFPNAYEPCGDLLFSLLQVKEKVNSLNISSPLPIILAGDVFDAKICSSSMLDWAIRIFRDSSGVYFSDATVVCYVQGQHDATVPTWLSLVRSDSIHLHRQRVDFGGITFRGFDYCYRLEDLDKFLDEMSSEPPYVLITHFPFEFVSGSYAILEKYSNLLAVISGDYHVPMEKDLKNKARFYSVGAMHPNRINDIHKFSYLLLYSNDGMLEVERCPLVTRPVFNKELFRDTDVDDMLQVVLDCWEANAGLPIQKPVVVCYTSDSKLISYAKTTLSEYSYLFFRPQKLDNQEDESEIEGPGSGTALLDLKDAFRQYFRNKYGDRYGEVAAYLFEACRFSKDPRTVILRKAAENLWEIFSNQRNRKEDRSDAIDQSGG